MDMHPDRKRLSLLLAAVAVVASAVGVSIGYFLAIATYPRDEFNSKLDEVRAYVRQFYYGKLDEHTLQRKSIDGMMQALDPYCEYFTAEEWKEFEQEHLQGEFGGVGIIVEMDKDGFARVITPMEDTPAFSADIQPGDFILEVDGVELKGMTLTQIVKRIRGTIGTQVKLKIARQGKDPFEVVLTRAKIKINPVKHSMIDEDNKIGYIRITDFSKMIEQFDKAADDLTAAGARALIVDLRSNSGGLLDQCVALADRFLDKGTIVKIESKVKWKSREETAKPGDKLEAIPLAVLVNEGTASASEIFSGAIKDHGRGAIVGTHTWGKGLVQESFRLSDGSRVKLTIARYLTPNGNEINREAGKYVEPTHKVVITPEEFGRIRKAWTDQQILKRPKPEPPADKQLDKALELLRTQLNGK